MMDNPFLKAIMARGGLGVGRLQAPDLPPPPESSVPKPSEPSPSVGNLLAAGLLGGLGGFMGNTQAGAQYADQWRKRQERLAGLLQQQQADQRANSTKLNNPVLQALYAPNGFVL